MVVTAGSGTAGSGAGRGPVRGRLVRGGLLATAVATVIALDTGLVPLPFSTPVPVRGSEVGPAAGAMTAPDQARQREVRGTVAALDAALANDDAAAFDRLVDPAATARPAVQRIMRNLAALPLDAGLQWDGTWGLDVSNGLPPDASTRIVAHTSFRTTFAGYDTGPTPVAVDVGLRKVAGRWLVTSWQRRFITKTVDPWELDVDVAAVAQPHVVVVGNAKNAKANARLAERAEAAAVDAREVWTDPAWNGKAVLFALTDQSYLDSWFGPGLAGPGQENADYFSAQVSEDPLPLPRRTGMRLVLGTDFVLRDTRATRGDLRYAFTVLSWRTGPVDSIPAWLYNGAADYTAWRPGAGKDALKTLRRRGLQDGTWRRLRAGTWKPTLTDDSVDFRTGDDATVEGEWDSAFLTATYIADTFGEGRLRALVAATAAARSTDAAVKQVLKMTRSELAANVGRYARRLAARA